MGVTGGEGNNRSYGHKAMVVMSVGMGSGICSAPIDNSFKQRVGSLPGKSSGIKPLILQVCVDNMQLKFVFTELLHSQVT